jgi:two-component system OmpR family sensor kinase
MTASIERRISRMLVTIIVTAALSSALVNFFFAYQEAEAFQDETIRQVAFLVSGSGWDPRSASLLDDETPEALSRLIVVRTPPGRMPDWIPDRVGPGFQTIGRGSDRMRVFVRDNPTGERIMIAQSTQLRDDIAFDSALPALVPLFLILPLMVLLTVHIVRSELARVRKLAEAVDRNPPDRLEALPSAEVPAELGLFVSAINRLMTRINRLLEQQRRFIADAAHELRSPLTALALQAKNVEKADSLEAVRERMLALKSGIQRAHRVAEQLLSLAKAGTESQPGRVDVSRLVRELIQHYQPLAQLRAIDLGLEECEHIEVIANADALALILKNALDNALTYTPAQGEVTVRLFREGDDVIVEVVDSGPGIALEERERVFAPFYRVPGTPGDGSGLGLAIAHDAANRIGGNITLYNRNPGLVFHYRQKGAVQAQKPALAPSPAPSEARPGSNARRAG